MFYFVSVVDLFQPEQHEEGDGGEPTSDPLLERNCAVTVIVNLGHHVGQDLKYFLLRIEEVFKLVTVCFMSTPITRSLAPTSLPVT